MLSHKKKRKKKLKNYTQWRTVFQWRVGSDRVNGTSDTCLVYYARISMSQCTMAQSDAHHVRRRFRFLTSPFLSSFRCFFLSSSFSCSSCSCGHTIPIRAGVLTSLCTARLPLSRPRIKAPKSSPAAQHALIRRSLSISNVACVPHVHRTISRRVLSALSPYVRRPSLWHLVDIVRAHPFYSSSKATPLGTACLLCSYAIIAPPMRV